MRSVNEVIFENASTLPNVELPAIDISTIFRASIQLQCESEEQGVNGTVYVQYSNDKPPASNLSTAAFTPTNWLEIPENGFQIGPGANEIFLLLNGNDTNLVCYQYMRIVYQSQIGGAQTITTVGNVDSSLAGKYFLFNGPDDAGPALYYVWYSVDFVGPDPMVVGRTGVEIPLFGDNDAATVAQATANELDNLPDLQAGTDDNIVIIENQISGAFTPASDVDTGFTFEDTTVAGTMNVNVKMLGL